MYFTVKELSDYLNIKAPTLYAWVGGEKIPYIRIHGLVRFRQEEINGWVESFRKTNSKSLPKNFKKNGTGDFEVLFERTRREIYNAAPRGNQTKIRPKKGGKKYGPV